MTLHKYYLSIDQLFNSHCSKTLTRKYKNVRNIILYADLWNQNSEKTGTIQYYFNADTPNNIETFICITIPELNISIKTKPDIGLDQSIIDYISSLNNLDVDNYKINIDYFIMDKDIITDITPGLCCTLFIENI
jgi:hypothetical protein